MCFQHMKCSVDNAFGYSLSQGVTFIGFFTIVVSLVGLVVSAALVQPLLSQPPNQQPLTAASLILVLVLIGLSFYQLVVSLLLIWQAMRTEKGNIYLCSVWYVSHLALLAAAAVLAAALGAVCYSERRYGPLVAVLCCASLYQGIFIYFCTVVNSYIHSMNVERYF